VSAPRRFVNLFRRRALERELDAEVQFHLESRIAIAVRAGRTRAEAEAEARAAFGHVGRVTESMREIRTMTRLESLLQDLRYGARSLARGRFSTAAVAATLALGIGANVAIFTLLNALWLRPLPYANADRLVVLEDSFTRTGITHVTPTVPEFLDVRAWNRSFDAMAFLDHRDLLLTGGEEPTRVFGGRVTASFFRVLGADAALGRVFTDLDNQPGHEQVALLSDGLWRRAFGADPAVVGRVIQIDRRPHQVVGVLPAGFAFDHPSIGIREPADVYVPFLMSEYYTSRQGSHSHLRRVLALARLRPGVAIDAARAEMQLIAARLTQAHPELYRNRPSGEDMGFTMLLRPLHDAVAGDARTVLFLLLACVAMVLLIACANTAQFLLARALQRRDEVAVRLALGASRGRLVQQFLCEAFGLAATATILGLAAAHLLVRGFVALVPTTSPLLARAGVDASVIGFAAALAALCALLFGLLPAWSGSHATRRVVRGRGVAVQPHYLLVAVEVALSMVLLAGAAVLVRGLLEISLAPRGYTAEHVTVLQLRLTQPRPELRQNGALQYEAYLEAIRQVPGVEAASVLSGQPVPLTDAEFVIGEHAGDAAALARRTARLIVGPEYFRVLQVPMLEGRAFTLQDRAGQPPVAIVTADVARRLWPNGSAIGRQLRLPQPTTIVGVVGATRLSSAQTDSTPQVYVPSLQVWEPNASIWIRTAANVTPPIPAFKQAIWSVAPDQAVFNIRSMEEMLSRSVADPRFRTALLAAFAALALLMSSAGVYGLVSYLVSQRTREIAIRAAIGAQRRSLYWLVSRQTVVSTCLGVAVGLAAAVALAGLLTRFTVVGRLDLPILAGIAILHLAIALAATYVPARRAFQLDAMRALGTN
jgi:putative ABC transport system permease protein